jgi:REP element-mobilizing transposase RayT
VKYDPQKHDRRSIRLKGYDYTQSGAYFVTIVTWQRQHLFGQVIEGAMRLSEWGQIARDEWFKTSALRTYVELFEDEFVVMPNHVHGIIRIHNADPHDAHPHVPLERRSEIVGRNCPCLQICGDIRRQRSAKPARRGALATELFRTYHPR